MFFVLDVDKNVTLPENNVLAHRPTDKKKNSLFLRTPPPPLVVVFLNTYLELFSGGERKDTPLHSIHPNPWRLTPLYHLLPLLAPNLKPHHHYDPPTLVLFSHISRTELKHEAIEGHERQFEG